MWGSGLQELYREIYGLYKVIWGRIGMMEKKIETIV